MTINIKDYWLYPPPEPSANLTKWIARIEGGWRPNKRIRSLGYHESAAFYGVYIWEYINVIYPTLNRIKS